jgi:hypothetical protein
MSYQFPYVSSGVRWCSRCRGSRVPRNRYRS